MSGEPTPRPPEGELFQSPDVEQARAFFQTKSRAMTVKLMTVSEAVDRFIHEGDYLATGGFGGVRIATSVMHEILRRRYTRLGFSGHSTTHDFQILAAGECFDRCDAAYVVGLERRGMSPNARRYMESGRVRVTEWSNATLGWRYKAAAMGVPFLPTACLMGTDTMTRSAAREIACPFTGRRLLAVPALFPDVGVIHVHRADVHGNAQVDGVTIADWDIARACKRLIITTEALVETEEIRRRPATTVVPYWLTDAVCHVPYGSYPGNMPFEYYSDETHLGDWMRAEQDPEIFAEFLDTYIYGTRNFNEYLTLNGGEERMAELRALEPLRRG
jgi:glutaconate CoA-transferase subunit A